jgi:CubicO group peptidase (beta-lactamase class C family)
MKKTTFLFLIISAVLFNPVRSQSISDLLNGYYAYNRFWGNVLIAQNGKIIFQQSYGFADKGRNIKNDSSTLFNLASVAKTMTAAAIFKLHDEGKLSLYDRVDKYIPGFVDDKTDSLTIINLLNHTSGMVTNPSNREDIKKEVPVLSDKEPVTLEQIISQFRETKLKSKPGTTFEYNNYGYIFLAYIIERVSGMDFFNYLNSTVLSKAGMTHTLSQLDLPGTEATGHIGIGTDNIHPVKSLEHPSWYTGAAGIYSTAGDLCRFLQSVFSHELFSERTLKLMIDSSVITHRGNILWTSGWQKNEVDGQDWYSHGGSIEGFSARIGYIPRENISIVILSNLVKDYKHDEMSSVNFSFVDEITENIIKILHGKTVAYIPVPNGKADEKLIGNYKLDDTHFLSVSFRNDSLFLTTEINSNFTLFDYSLNKEINDTLGNYKICKIFTSSLVSNNFDGFEKYATEEMQKDFFNEKGMTELINFWQRILSKAGKYLSSNICDKIVNQGHTDYSLIYHFEEAEVTMQLSFNDNGLINGFYILKVIPKCRVYTVNLIPTGKDEYFVDGYKYGGYNDFRVKYNSSKQYLTFNSDKVSFQAFKFK